LGHVAFHGVLIYKYAAESLVLEEPDIYSTEGKWEERARVAKKMKLRRRFIALLWRTRVIAELISNI